MANIVKNNSLTKLMRMKMKDGRLGNAAIPRFGDNVSGSLNFDSSEDNGIAQKENYSLENSPRVLEKVQRLIHEAITMKKTDSTDMKFSELCEEYRKLDWDNKRMTLFVLATQYGIDRVNVRNLIKHYMSLDHCDGKHESNEFTADNELNLTALYRAEEKIRSALTPNSARLFERINWQPGGLKFLVDLRADLRATIQDQNLAPLRALDTELKNMLANWLSPAGLELHQITWNDSASLLEKIVAYEAVHPVSNLYDLKRRLGVGRRCFGYFHPSIPGEPLIFIQVALTKNIVESIQEVLWDEPPIAELEATTALFYSISSTQPGLSGINLGKFLIKRVVRLLQQEMPNIQTFVTLSPVPGFMQWLLPKLASQAKFATLDSADTQQENLDVLTFKEELISPSEKLLLESFRQLATNTNPSYILWNWLTSPASEWTRSEQQLKVMQPILLRLCARYILEEKKRGRALDPVTNFHAQNGAIVESLNWMGDKSEYGLAQSAGIMVNYLYRLENIEENSQMYFDNGVVPASPKVEYLRSPTKSLL